MGLSSLNNNERIEITILRNLVFNEDFTRKALPFVKTDYFTNRTERLLYEEIDKFVQHYKNLPTPVPARATFKVLLGTPPFVILLKKDKSNLYFFSLV